jgi:hypothetical protein
LKRVQAVLNGHNQPRYKKREIPFRGLLTCAHGLPKSRSRNTITIRSGSKGKCELPYLREEKLSKRLGQILKDIHIPDDVLIQLEDSLTDTERRSQSEKKEQQGQRQKRSL